MTTTGWNVSHYGDDPRHPVAHVLCLIGSWIAIAGPFSQQKAEAALPCIYICVSYMIPSSLTASVCSTCLISLMAGARPTKSADSWHASVLVMPVASPRCESFAQAARWRRQTFYPVFLLCCRPARQLQSSWIKITYLAEQLQMS